MEGPGRKDEEYVRVKSSSMDSHIVDSALKANFKINVVCSSVAEKLKLANDVLLFYRMRKVMLV